MSLCGEDAVVTATAVSSSLIVLHLLSIALPDEWSEAEENDLLDDVEDVEEEEDGEFNIQFNLLLLEVLQLLDRLLDLLAFRKVVDGLHE